MTQQRSHLTVTSRDGVNVVEFADRKILDELCIAEIREELTALVGGAGTKTLLLSFRNVDYLSSAALSVLITLNNQVGAKDGRLMLSDISPQIFEVFKITKLNKLFKIYDTAEDALAHA
jgi:anti-sigma B factor antagonist